MKAYIFYFKNDISCEPIGRVMATCLDEAREYVIQIKKLPDHVIDDLFVIKPVQQYEDSI